MTIALIIGVGLFAAFALLFLFALPRPSVESALLDKMARDASAGTTREGSRLRPGAMAEFVAQPFTLFRKCFSSGPDPEVVRRLMLAGYRKPSHADIFLGSRLAVPAILGVLVALIFTDNVILYFFLAVVLGFFAPDFWLSSAINRRREKLQLSLPDGLDLLSICLEAGLGLDQGIVRVGHELSLSHRELSEELLLINFEQRAGATRFVAWRSFAERANFESARSFVAMLMQTDRFGTPIAKALSNFSDALRTQRRQKAEEMAAKTTVKLVPPLVFFIFPSMGIVVVGPAVLTVMKNLAHIV
jgi:tight adherence protein C